MLYIDERAVEEGLSRRIILKEAFQIAFLEGLYSLPESETFTFQGGTCIRLLYGGPRYSEDLDFVVSEIETPGKIFRKLETRLHKLSALFEGNIRMRVQKEAERLVRWRIYLEREDDFGSTSVSVEFAAYPVYTSRLLPLNFPRGYPFSPLVLVKAEAEEELLADKIIAVAGRKYLKGRDIFDIWLLKNKGVKVDMQMVRKKMKDYSVEFSGVTEKVLSLTERELRQDIETYLPGVYREKIEVEGYGLLLKTAASLIKGVKRALKK